MNLWQYGAISGTLLTAVVANAFFQREQFYLACVYITRSNANLLILYNMALVFVLMAGKVFRRVFFGQLRAMEVEVCVFIFLTF